MIPFQEIMKYSKEVPPEIIERDYCIGWLLFGISRSLLQKDLIFYGGTALKKIYSPDFRFSEDLDFVSEKNLRVADILKELNRAYGYVPDKANIIFNTSEETVSYAEDRLQLFAKYDGFPEISLIKQVKLDIVFRQKVFEKPLRRKIISIYSDKKEMKGELQVYSLEAITAEKLSAIFDLTRKEPRDLYDLNFLLKQPKLDYKKALKYLKIKYGFMPPLSSLLSNIEAEIYRHRWETRLRSQVIKLDKIDKTLESLENNLKRLYQ